ncbi:MAG: hypothetical protein RL380_248 [Verrucomicrobiota bacterium]
MRALNPGLPIRFCVAAFGGVLWLATPVVPAQVLQTWTQHSIAGSSVTNGESSAVVAVGTNYFFVADNEHETLRLFTRYPTSSCVDPVYSTNLRSSLNLAASNPEVDLEAAVQAPNTNRIYWLGSHSNSKSGNLRPNRDRIFATTVLGDGTGSPPYSLAYVGRYDYLRVDLANWDRTNAHGLGTNYFGLVASTNSGVPSEDVNGFNLEGLGFAPDGMTAYLGFRTPLVNGSGQTTATAQRTNALIVPLLNVAELVTNNPVAGPGKAKFGVPFTLRLGARGIRSLDSNHAGNFLITAGPPGDASSPPVAPLNFRLFTWTGQPTNAPIERLTDFPDGYSPEGAVPPTGALTSNTVVQFVSDDSAACWKSFTTLVGMANQPSLQMLAPSNNLTRFNLQLPTTQAVTVEYSSNFANWFTLRTLTNASSNTVLTDAPATNARRFYRAKF